MPNVPGLAEVQTFIGAAKAAGASDEILVSLLRERGWPERLIYDALSAYYELRTGLPIPARSATGGNAKDTFLYLLSLITLGMWTCSIGSILFTLIDRWFPDPALTSPYSYSYQLSNLAWEIAAIIVAFPVYLWLMRGLLVDLEQHPEKVFSTVRKWFTYLALFVTAFVLVGDAVTLLGVFLRGELTTRFVLKVITIFFISGAIFWYYRDPLSAQTAPEEASHAAA
jgi:hypothetical protein